MYDIYIVTSISIWYMCNKKKVELQIIISFISKGNVLSIYPSAARAVITRVDEKEDFPTPAIDIASV